MKIFGIILILLGALAFLYKGVTYKTQEKVLDVGPLEVNKEEKHTIPYSPILGGAAIVGGIVMIALSEKKSRIA